MKWEPDAQKAIKKVPFFVRKKVKTKVENFVKEKGGTIVSLSDVTGLKRQFLAKGGMEKHIKGYDISTCFGSSGCHNIAMPVAGLAKKVKDILEKEDILSFLKQQVKDDLKFHHELKVVLCDCPNACARPQIADIGIIGAAVPGVSDQRCSLCGVCQEICPDQAVALDKDAQRPEIDPQLCLNCGLCIRECPTGTLIKAKEGYRILLGGRLGRHPRLAMELDGIFTEARVLEIVKKCLCFYKKNSRNGRRFSHILRSVDQLDVDS